jgi:UDP-N-acetylmuramoylalanine--D-glutamate ligase
VARRVLVAGLGRSGRAAALALARRGWEVVAVDAASVEHDALTSAGVEVRAPSEAAVPDLDLVVKSPGVPDAFPPVAAARAGGVPVWSEIELAARELVNPVLAVTGTNGKTTTTELTAHLLRAAGIDAVACGNQGTPVTELLDGLPPQRWLVIECSSFQLEDVHEFRPSGAALLNVAPDHLDRHGDLERYLQAKLRIFRRQEGDDLAIAPAGVNVPGGARRGRISHGGAAEDVVAWGEGGLHVAGLGHVCDWEATALRGRHNRENMMVAAALAAHAGADAPALARGLAGFPGVAHRLEVVGEIDGVVYVNDSKATNPDAAMAALDAYDVGVHLIVGGRAKGTPFGPLAQAARGAVVRAYAIGEAAPDLTEALGAAGVPVDVSGTLQVALAAARERARPGETVLLAPACASFDQFRSFEERGDVFRALVRAA